MPFEMMKLNHAIKANQYSKSIPNYSSYTRVQKSNNGSSVIAKKIIIQSIICIAVVICIVFLQNRTEKLPQNIISNLRTLVVERHTSVESIYINISDTYNECVDYIQGTHE
ncbi:MAG TPA: hypothetical protein VFD00_07020 [Thermoclostridium sp.]|nr:hypothetical protein [Thermoclostridium sp.]